MTGSPVCGAGSNLPWAVLRWMMVWTEVPYFPSNSKKGFTVLNSFRIKIPLFFNKILASRTPDTCRNTKTLCWTIFSSVQSSMRTDQSPFLTLNCFLKCSWVGIRFREDKMRATSCVVPPLGVLLRHRNPSATGASLCSPFQREDWWKNTYWFTLVRVKGRTGFPYDDRSELVLLLLTCVSHTFVTGWVPEFSNLKAVKTKVNKNLLSHTWNTPPRVWSMLPAAGWLFWTVSWTSSW